MKNATQSSSKSFVSDRGHLLTRSGILRRILRYHHSLLCGETNCGFFRHLLEYVGVMAITATVLSILEIEGRTDLDEVGWGMMFFASVIVAPLLETWIFQSWFHAIARRLKLGGKGTLLMVFFPFAIVHFRMSISSGVAAGVIGGYYYGLLYINRRYISFSRAYWTTVAFHALSNVVAFAILILSSLF